MLESLRGEFKLDLETVPWMDDSTRVLAVQKLEAMNFEVNSGLWGCRFEPYGFRGFSGDRGLM